LTLIRARVVSFCCVGLLLSGRIVLAQDAAAPAAAVAKKPAPVSDTVVVLGEVAPVSLGQAARPVVAIDLQDERLVNSDVEDGLRTDASVDIQQRGAGGVMNDVSVRGATFEQTLVLLNGLRVDDVETAHFNLDLPVPMAALAGADVLHGAGSTLYGSDAIGGVVDFTTWQPEVSTLRLRAGAGSFSEDQEGVVGALVMPRWSEVLAADRDRSEGFTVDRDYRTEDLSSETRLRSALGATDVLLAMDDRVYGANQFYGPYNSWERTKGWFAALTQEVNEHTSAAVAYRRHTDEFVLFRNDPAAYENNHIDQSYEGAVRDTRTIFKHTTLLTGLEETADQINSTNLGNHGRNRGAGYADVEFRVPSGSLSAGVREEIFSGGRAVTSPMVEGTLRLAKTVKARGSVGYGFRLPTFLDLYYSDPVTLGNANLKPESAWNYEGGVDWYLTGDVAVSVTGFTSVQKNTIDYTRPVGATVYTATNLGSLQFTGAEASAEWRVTGTQQVRLSWTYLHGTQSALGANVQSEYVFNYPVNNGRAEWRWKPRQGVLVQSRLGVLERFTQAPAPANAPYAVWDVSAARDAGWWRPYVQMSNLANTGYQEIVNVPMPGRSFVGGVEFVWARKR
jgi:iron complex outermembrane receptor protein